MHIEKHSEAGPVISLRNSQEELLAIAMVLELSRRFGLRHPHNVASILKVSHAEAERLLGLAAAKPQSA